MAGISGISLGGGKKIHPSSRNPIRFLNYFTFIKFSF